MIAIKKNFKKELLAIVLIIVFASFLRFYRLPELAKISYDEARDLIAARQIITRGKLTLIGPETTVGNKTFYFGPLHYYLIAPALAIARFNPLGPIFLTAILGVITALLIYLTSRKISSGLFYAVFPLAVIFNRWAWNPNTIPLFIAIALYFLFRRKTILSGIFLGLATQLHFTAALSLLLILPYVFIKGGGKKSIIRLICGVIIGISPLIIFELRHNFFSIKNIFGLLVSPEASGRSLNWHYFIWSFPFLSLMVGSLNKYLRITIISVSLTISLFWLLSQKPDFARNPRTIEKIALLIATDQQTSQQNFNVATFTDSDTRATSYRYFLELKGTVPLDVLEYSVADHLYVISYDGPSKILYNKTYEISSFQPKRVSRFWTVGDENIYRLERK